jgi:hypothetical protein
MTGLVASPLTPFAKTATRVYKEGVENVNFSTSIYSFMGLVTGIPANALIPKLGIRNSTLIATFMFLVGMFVRTLLGKSFYMVHIGQAIAGLGSPFVGNGIGGFAAHWYSGPTVSSFFKRPVFDQPI